MGLYRLIVWRITPTIITVCKTKPSLDSLPICCRRIYIKCGSARPVRRSRISGCTYTELWSWSTLGSRCTCGGTRTSLRRTSQSRTTPFRRRYSMRKVHSDPTRRWLQICSGTKCCTSMEDCMWTSRWRHWDLRIGFWNINLFLLMEDMELKDLGKFNRLEMELWEELLTTTIWIFCWMIWYSFIISIS